MSGTRSQFLRAGAARLTKVALLSFIHHRALRPLLRAPASSFLARIVADRPEIRGMVLTPYVCATWDAPTRLARVADHCRIAERLGPAFALTSRDYVELMPLPQIAPGYHVQLDSPRWTTRDGLLMLSLWYEQRRMFTLSFTLTDADGALTAYVGGVQGQRGPAMLDLYRAFTKAAFGTRPRDMVIELFRMLCETIGVARIRCMSDANRHQRSRYMATRGGDDPVELSYDAIWRDRGAVLADDGFFHLPVHASRRGADAVPANKRSQYRKRYAMLDEIAQCLKAVVRNPRAIAVRQHGVHDAAPSSAGDAHGDMADIAARPQRSRRDAAARQRLLS